MDIDFTKEMIEDINENNQNIYQNFCLLDDDIFWSGKVIGRQFDFLLKPDCLLEVENYISSVKEATKWSLKEPSDRCIKMLEFILNKGYKDMKQYCAEFDLVYNYEPSQEDIEKYMPNPYTDDFYEDIYEKCLEEGYEKALLVYKKNHERELKGLDMLRKCLYEVEKERYAQECKREFTNVALKYKGNKSNKIYKISDFIVGTDKNKESLLKQVFYGKKGKEFALYMIASGKINLLKVSVRSSFYKCIRESWKVDIGTDQSINKHLIKTGNKLREIREYAFFSNEEVENAINSIKSML